MGDFLIIPCLNCIKITQKQTWRSLIYFAWMKSMYFREYVCRFSRKLHYFCILCVSHLKVTTWCCQVTNRSLNQCWHHLEFHKMSPVHRELPLTRHHRMLAPALLVNHRAVNGEDSVEHNHMPVSVLRRTIMNKAAKYGVNLSIGLGVSAQKLPNSQKPGNTRKIGITRVYGLTKGL